LVKAFVESAILAKKNTIHFQDEIISSSVFDR
jgi:hypothetical protein